MAAVDEEKRKRTAFPTDIPEQSIYGRGAVRQPAAPAQPLDAQAASDREAIGRAWGAVKNTSQKAGAAIADIGTLPIRAAAGAYDTAVIRPMRAAGLNAAYTSPLVNPASNASGASMTPFYDQMRSRDASGVQASYSNEGRNSKQPTMDPAAPAAAAIVAAAPEGVNASQTSPQAPAAQPVAGPQRIDKPGTSPLFTNLPADDPSNVSMMARGAPTAQNMAAADALASRYATQAQPATQQQPTAVIPKSTGGFGLLSDEARAARELNMQMQRGMGETARAYAARMAALSAAQGAQASREGNQLNAEVARDRNTQEAGLGASRMRLDEQRAATDAMQAQDNMATNSVKRGAAQLEMGAAQQLADLSRQYLEAPDEATRAEVAKQLAALGVKSEKADAQWDSIVVNGGTDAMGNRIGGTAMLYNKVTGEMKPAGATPRQEAPASAIEFLKKNPGQARAFKDKYGYLPEEIKQ